MKKTIGTTATTLGALFSSSEKENILTRYSANEEVNVLITPMTPGNAVYIENYFNGTTTSATTTDSTPILYGTSLAYKFKVFDTTSIVASASNTDVRFLFI